MSEKQPVVTMVPFEVQRAEQFARARDEALANRRDETVPGGRYAAADGSFVDANGEPVKAEAKPDARKADR